MPTMPPPSSRPCCDRKRKPSQETKKTNKPMTRLHSTTVIGRTFDRPTRACQELRTSAQRRRRNKRAAAVDFIFDLRSSISDFRFQISDFTEQERMLRCSDHLFKSEI